MKIKTKDGRYVIDLAKLRQRCEENVADRSHPLGTIATREDLALLDALEAALDVQTSTPASDTWQRGWNACKNAVREAAGVIEETPVADETA